MSSIIKQRRSVHVEHYEREYVNNDGVGGYSFACNKEGKVIMSQIAATAYANLRGCMDGTFDVTYVGVRDCSHDYWDEAVLRCDCRREVTLYHSFTNECECGRLYNGFGQQLAPRSQW